MEWVTTAAKTVEEAKEQALERLGVLSEDAEFEILEEPKSGLFGRTRGEAKVRARIKPTPVRAKPERKDRRRGPSDDKPAEATPAETKPAAQSSRAKSSESAPARQPAAAKESAPTTERPARRSSGRGEAAEGGRNSKERSAVATSGPAVVDKGTSSRTQKGTPMNGQSESSDRPSRQESSESEVDAVAVGAEAERFMVGLLDAFGLEGSVEVRVDGEDIEVLVTGEDLGVLIGPKGATLLALQDITRVASQRRLGDHNTHLRIDVGGYRERRREALVRFTTQQADLVRESGTARALEPMPSADRKIVHDTITGLAGVGSRSEGDDPRRRVVIVPAAE